jgi:hypothetical protein
MFSKANTLSQALNATTAHHHDKRSESGAARKCSVISIFDDGTGMPE